MTAEDNINILLSRYRFILSLNNVPPTAYYKNIDEYRDEIKLKIEELKELIK